MLFTPKVKVTYWPRDNWDALRRQMFATGVWRGALIRRQGKTPLRYLPPPAVVLAVIVAVVLIPLQLFGVLSAPAWSLLYLPVLGYLAGVTVVGLTRLGGESITDRLLNVVVLATMHLAWGAGFLRGWLFGGRSTVDRSRVR